MNMSVDPLRTLVRRLRAAAHAEDELLSAALAALPGGGTLRLYYFCRDTVQQAHIEHDTDGSSDYDLPACPPAGAPTVAAQAPIVDPLDMDGGTPGPVTGGAGFCLGLTCWTSLGLLRHPGQLLILLL